MTDQHPLTDEICRVIEEDLVRKWGFDYDDYMCMRAGADWQLEQVIRYLENDLKFVLWTDDFMDKFKKAMRPQEDN